VSGEGADQYRAEGRHSRQDTSGAMRMPSLASWLRRPARTREVTSTPASVRYAPEEAAGRPGTGR
jgi:hypothetical protein